MPALIIVGLWNVGTSMLIYLAALHGVPQSLYDAASVDGANGVQRFFAVTLPMVTPAMFFNVVLGVIGAFQVFTIAYIITNGGPGQRHTLLQPLSVPRRLSQPEDGLRRRACLGAIHDHPGHHGRPASVGEALGLLRGQHSGIRGWTEMSERRVVSTIGATARSWAGSVRHAHVITALRYLALTGLALLYAMPFVWMISISLKPFSDLDQVPPLLIPSRIAWENYPQALFQPMIYFPQFFVNTVYYVGLTTLGELLSSAIVAYGFARIPFRGSNILFALVLSTMMLPYQVTLIPEYVVFKELGWIDTYLPLIVPSWFGVPFFIFLFRQFFLTIPRELDDAAMIDGASHFDILFRIIVPLSVPAVITCIALSIVTRWNDFFGPLIYINSTEKQTVAVALTYFNVPQQVTPQNYLMAAAVVTVIPVILIFLFLQDYFVQGVTMTGLKEG